MNIRTIIHVLVADLFRDLQSESDRKATEYANMVAEQRKLQAHMDAGRIEAFDMEVLEPPPAIEIKNPMALENELVKMFEDFQRILEPDSDVTIPGVEVRTGDPLSEPAPPTPTPTEDEVKMSKKAKKEREVVPA
jgi:hypothetical protein